MKTQSRTALSLIAAISTVYLFANCAVQKHLSGSTTSSLVQTQGAQADSSRQMQASDEGEAQGTCADPHAVQPKTVAGFCVTAPADTKPRATEIQLLTQKLNLIQKRFPLLIDAVHANGFREIMIQGTELVSVGENGLAETRVDEKRIVLFRPFFSIDQSHSKVSNLGFSMAEVSLVHELIHAFDGTDELVKSHLDLVGWDASAAAILQNSNSSPIMPDGNLWVSASEINDLKAKLSPLIESQGRWKVYALAREEMKKYGYPSMYAALGGPRESFAELAAYAAVDPNAASYMKPETLAWLRSSVLK